MAQTCKHGAREDWQHLFIWAIAWPRAFAYMVVPSFFWWVPRLTHIFFGIGFVAY